MKKFKVSILIGEANLNLKSYFTKIFFPSQVENQTIQPGKNSKSKSYLTNGEANLNLKIYFKKKIFQETKSSLNY